MPPAADWAPINLPTTSTPYRLLDEAGHEIAWANDFLDAQHIRQLSARSLRAYAFDLSTSLVGFRASPRLFQQSRNPHLLDYVRYQLRPTTEQRCKKGNS